MPEPPPIEHMRALRRDAYRCQHRISQRGICGRRTHLVRREAGGLLTVCAAHLVAETED